MNIIPKNIVYISENSNKYHTNPHCSGIKNVREIPFGGFPGREVGWSGCAGCHGVWCVLC